MQNQKSVAAPSSDNPVTSGQEEMPSILDARSIVTMKALPTGHFLSVRGLWFATCAHNNLPLPLSLIADRMVRCIKENGYSKSVLVIRENGEDVQTSLQPRHKLSDITEESALRYARWQQQGDQCLC